MAIPVTGAAAAVSSNNFTVPVGGAAAGDVWIAWGEASGCENWASQYETSSGGAVSVKVYGAPLVGGSTVYFYACDSTGCDTTNEQTVTIPAITTLPTPTFGAAYKNITARHLSPPDIGRNLMTGYTATGAPATLLYGLVMFFLIFGIWFRTRSVRLPLIVGMLMAAFVASPQGGLFLGTPILFQQVAMAFAAACLAGILIGFIRK